MPLPAAQESDKVVRDALKMLGADSPPDLRVANAAGHSFTPDLATSLIIGITA